MRNDRGSNWISGQQSSETLVLVERIYVMKMGYRLLVVSLASIIWVSTAFAHGGRTDSLWRP